MLNICTIMGRLGRDPELTFTPNGKAVCKFSIATSEYYKNSAGERQDRTTWHNVVIWGKSGESANQILKKGALVCIFGKIENRTYNKKDGGKGFVSEIVVGPRGQWVLAAGGKEKSVFFFFRYYLLSSFFYLLSSYVISSF